MIGIWGLRNAEGWAARNAAAFALPWILIVPDGLGY